MKYGPQSGPKPQTPPRGKNGPGDGGKTDGTKHYAHSNLPTPNKPRPGATKAR